MSSCGSDWMRPLGCWATSSKKADRDDRIFLMFSCTRDVCVDAKAKVGDKLCEDHKALEVIIKLRNDWLSQNGCPDKPRLQGKYSYYAENINVGAAVFAGIESAFNKKMEDFRNTFHATNSLRR